jgi:alpha-mannosidase
MSIQRAAVILPCNSWDDFPTHLGDQAAAELLSAWTALWHPAVIAATGRLPGWHQAEEPPDPASFEGELILVPPPSRVRMPGDWCERLAATAPKNPPPVETTGSRAETVIAMLAGAGLDAGQVSADKAADFFALGYAYLQIELLTRAMRYSSVLDADQFESAVVAAAKAAVAGDQTASHDELARAFDLLADARNHVYSVDFYAVDITLVADSTMGEALRAKLATDGVTNLLVTGEQLDRMEREFPETLAELKRGVSGGTAAIVGGPQVPISIHSSPEALLANLLQGQDTAQRVLGREFEVFAQYKSAFFHLLPEVLKGAGFRGALHAGFDGGPLPRAEQRKTYWGPHRDASIEALSATPLDASRAETWLKFAERVGDSIAHDHVATIVVAAWPGTESEYLDDLRRVARFGTALGRLITLDEYFRVTREPDDWTTFFPREYPSYLEGAIAPNAISNSANSYRHDVELIRHRLGAALAGISGLQLVQPPIAANASLAVINPWSFEGDQLVGANVIQSRVEGAPAEISQSTPLLVPEILGCGFAALSTGINKSSVPLAEGLMLRNERMELIVSEKTGGIQSVRLHRDRSTRASQRLVFHHQRGGSAVESQMVADRVSITRNDLLVGEITSEGRIVDGRKELLARFTQRVRVARGLESAIVDIELEPMQQPEGDIWHSYYASRIAWADEAVAVRRGQQWAARETEREHIESPEFVEIDDVIGRVTVFAMGLPFHRRPAPNWLDTLLMVAGEERRQFQFAIGLDQPYPTRGAVGATTSDAVILAAAPAGMTADRGWFLHIGAKNVLVTHVESLPSSATGMRVRLLEIEGRDTHAAISAFRPFAAARQTDFRATEIEVLSVTSGAAEVHLGPYRWVQIEAEWEV